MSTTITGQADFSAFLAALPGKLEANILRGGMRAGAKVIADQAKELVAFDGSDDAAHVRDSIKFSASSEPGLVTSKIQTKGPGAFKAPWLEYGTAAHFISVDESVSGGLTVRRTNKLAREGSLVISGHFVGTTVHHPGARPHPFMRPALDRAQGAAVEAIVSYVQARATKEGLLHPDPVPQDDDQ